VADGWREMHEKQQFYSFGAARRTLVRPNRGRQNRGTVFGSPPLRPYSQSRLVLPSKTPARNNNVWVIGDAAPAKRMISQNTAGLAIRPCVKFERKSF
jgi:hypothetical protein